MKAKATIFYTTLLITIIIACAKNNSQNTPVPPPVTGTDTTKPPVTGIDTGTKVYVSGIYNTRPWFQNVFWKNGVMTSLVNGISSGSPVISSIFVSDTNVYITGNAMYGDVATTGARDVAMYWKNNIPVLLDTSTSVFARSIVADGNDVYIAGDTHSSLPSDGAKFWKNRIISTLSGADYPSSYAYAICKSGNNIYVTGTEGRYDTSYAAYWKNGIVTHLTDGRNGGAGHSIFVNGNDVYVAGTEQRRDATNSIIFVAKYWKNGVVTRLSDSLITAYANSIYVSGNDVYVVGTVTNGHMQNAVYWKNGVQYDLTDKTKNSNANSIFVHGSDVYIAGEEDNGVHLVAKYWKNGVPVILTDGTQDAWALSIFVK